MQGGREGFRVWGGRRGQRGRESKTRVRTSRSNPRLRPGRAEECRCEREEETDRSQSGSFADVAAGKGLGVEEETALPGDATSPGALPRGQRDSAANRQEPTHQAQRLRGQKADFRERIFLLTVVQADRRKGCLVLWKRRGCQRNAHHS